MTTTEINQVNIIISFMRKWNLVDYEIHKNLSVTLNEDLYLDEVRNVDHIPISFRKINGRIRISNCSFIDMKGLPKKVESLMVTNCFNLISLEGCPQKITEHFIVEKTTISSLQYGPEYVGGKYKIDSKYLTNLHYIAKHIGELCLDDCLIFSTLDTGGIISIVDKDICIGATPLAKKLFKHKIPYCFNYENSFNYRLPGVVLKYANYIIDANGEVDVHTLADLIPEIKEGLK